MAPASESLLSIQVLTTVILASGMVPTSAGCSIARILRANTTYNMKVVNLSLGGNAVDTYTLDPLCLAVRKLVDAGIVVVAAAGNEGKDGSGNKIYGQIHSPGNEPSAITVGAVNTYGTDV